ncbi:hypothetical protein NA56DRAFT_711114 [Hyaloscypha hepaticicola]|uniref:Uncharacterized protein n=1 Tax=Hyaloscypha hepaticicola TaxID=2082293 RepID=A0A2J6PK99_9HELO|nr:hypothetical protein NA56DRAFT_711114 [Hyaloscypha hepaticicola]
MTTTTWLSTTRDRRALRVANCARRMTVSSSRLQSADLQHPESLHPIIVCPKSCLYPSLHIRRTFPSISGYPLHNPTSILQSRRGKQWGNSEQQKEGTPGSLQASSVNYTHINLPEGGSVHFIPTKPNHLNSRTASCLVTPTRISRDLGQSEHAVTHGEVLPATPFKTSQSGARKVKISSAHSTRTRIASQILITPAASTLKLQRLSPEIRFVGPQEPRQEAQLQRYIIKNHRVTAVIESAAFRYLEPFLRHCEHVLSYKVSSIYRDGSSTERRIQGGTRSGRGQRSRKYTPLYLRLRCGLLEFCIVVFLLPIAAQFMSALLRQDESSQVVPVELQAAGMMPGGHRDVNFDAFQKITSKPCALEDVEGPHSRARFTVG